MHISSLIFHYYSKESFTYEHETQFSGLFLRRIAADRTILTFFLIFGRELKFSCYPHFQHFSLSWYGSLKVFWIKEVSVNKPQFVMAYVRKCWLLFARNFWAKETLFCNVLKYSCFWMLKQKVKRRKYVTK